MLAVIRPDDALDRLLARDRWLWIKAPVLLFLAWTFFLPSVWKVILLLLASFRCSFVYPCFLGPEVSSFSVWFMLITQVAIVYLVLWYVAYAFAFALTPGVANRALGVVAVVLFPLVIIAVPLLFGLIGSLFNVPFESFWLYFDRWMPIASWRVTS